MNVLSLALLSQLPFSKGLQPKFKLPYHEVNLNPLKEGAAPLTDSQYRTIDEYLAKQKLNSISNKITYNAGKTNNADNAVKTSIIDSEFGVLELYLQIELMAKEGTP